MSEFFSYDPMTGVMRDMAEDNSTLTIHTAQDVQPILDNCERIRNSGITDKGIKEDWWPYCTIPAMVEVEIMQKYGLKINNKTLPQVLKIIDRDYPKLKYTTKKHVIKAN